MMDNLREILESLGYTLFDFGREYRARPLYRDSDNNTVLKINKKSGWYTDFKLSKSGPLEELIQITLGLKNIDEGKKYLKGKVIYNTDKKTKPKLKTLKVFNSDSLNLLEPDTSYWEKRGVSIDTINFFGGGIAKEGRMKDRYVFPIFNSKRKLIGLSGRLVVDFPSNSKKPKWKHMGNKSEWRYPFQFNLSRIQQSKEVILIESIGDMLSLWENNVRNTMVIFGLDISIPQLNTLIKLDPQRILISLNNDSVNNNAGNYAAEKLSNKLKKYFDFHQVQICLPDKGDFGEMTSEEVGVWKEKCNV
tara:strand:- start:1714 stop:2628 length:915 start_codon:yes stop_codon:yes gene_type:complete